MLKIYFFFFNFIVKTIKKIKKINHATSEGKNLIFSLFFVFCFLSVFFLKKNHATSQRKIKMQLLQNCIHPTIRIGQEIQCLPYAGLSKIVLGQLEAVGGPDTIEKDLQGQRPG